ncbi:MAG TPA: hypothetical protein PK046_01535 [Candidatus Syntrophosphaera sp.]|jgi:hypothetical protein|nr:hypothetical protein [Candidatus Cloacimonadota bacterium]HNU53425.1 hypothetical protein [Candidatus Syntrophosphaera sp.]HPW37983.1 hypothetical protein [Candidatus Syntrophosphaera sp.]HQC47145.1 hypothetical protein [Candidatus Syntrophosphaera sp.]
MLKRQDRFMNNELLGFISRPQYENSCSMSSLTAVINYLFSDQIGIKTTKEWAEEIEAPDPEEPLSPGNETMMSWFKLVCEHYGVEGKCDYFICDEDVEDWDDNPKVITKLKKAIKSKKQALIYHLDNHYNVIVGYFEHATDPDKAYDPDAQLQRWIVLGEHSDYNRLEDFPAINKILEILKRGDRYNLLYDRCTAPVWSIRWRTIRHDLINTPNHCILMFEK